MAERYWSVDDCCWVDCPEIPEQAAAIEALRDDLPAETPSEAVLPATS